MENGAGPFPSVWIIFESRDDPDIARRVLIEVKRLPPASKRRFDLRLSPIADVQGFFESVKVISSSRISCNRWSRRSWSAAAPPSLLCICVRFASLISAISSRSFLIRSDTSLGINTAYSSEGRLIVGRNAVTTQAPECPIWFCLAFGPVAGNLLAYPVGPSESSCNCEAAAPLKRPIRH